VRTAFGRIRLFPQLHQEVHRAVQEQALRAAVNTTIQGTAADLMKLAMLAVDRELLREGLEARILLQVHDELLLEIPRGAVGPVAEVVRRAMEGVHRLEVPLVVDQKTGQDWLEVT
jgi:DNA polymerase-1